MPHVDAHLTTAEQLPQDALPAVGGNPEPIKPTLDQSQDGGLGTSKGTRRVTEDWIKADPDNAEKAAPIQSYTIAGGLYRCALRPTIIRVPKPQRNHDNEC